MAIHAQVSSVSSVIPKACIERQTPEGPIFVPVIPLDQLPYSIEGVPSRINHRQLIKEGWQLLDAVTGFATVLSPLRTPPPSPKYRAPDHNATRDAAFSAMEMSNKPELRATSPHSSTSSEQYSVKRDQYGAEQLSSNSRTQIPPIDHRRHTIGHQPYVSTGHHASPPGIERKSMMTKDSNRARLSRFDVRYVQDGGRSVVAPNADVRVVQEPCIDGPRPVSSDPENDRISKFDCNENKLRIAGLLTTPVRADRPEKIYCDYWIRSKGECGFGSRCLYKHEMPSLDVLKEVTGFRSYPQWWKEQQAIRPRGMTWMEVQEARMRSQNDNSPGRNEAAEMPACREFPDPTSLRSLRQKSSSTFKQESPTSKDTQERTPASILVDVDSSTLPVHPKTSEIFVTTVGQEVKSSPVRSPAQTTVLSEEKKDTLTTLRRHSEISWSSDSTESTTSVKQRSKSKAYSNKSRQTAAQQPKKGLAASKYAPSEPEKWTFKVRRAAADTQKRLQGNYSALAQHLCMEEPVMEQRAVAKVNLI